MLGVIGSNHLKNSVLNPKILGIGLVVFCYFILYVFLKPKKGIDRSFFNNSMDSITVVHNQKEEDIISASRMKDIVNTIVEAEKIEDMDRPKANRDFCDIILYSKHKTSEVRLYLNAYYGVILQANDFYYHGDSLYSMIQNQILK